MTVTMEVTLPNNTHAGRLLGHRIRAWRDVADRQLYHRFWTEAGDCLCVVCGHTPDTLGLVSVGVIAPGGAAGELHLAGASLGALIESLPQPGEIWFGTCAPCARLLTPQERAALLNRARRLAAPYLIRN